MKIQNVVETITANPEKFDTHLTRTVSKRNNDPFLIDEYFITHIALDDYTTRVSVLDEDQNPIVTAVVDILDDIDEAERQIAFVGSISTRFRQNITDAQLRTILDSYELFVAKADFPISSAQDFDDLRLLQNVFSVIYQGGTVKGFFTPTATRKGRATDYSQHKFREVATEIANNFLLAS